MAQLEVHGIFEEIDEQLETENVARFWLKNKNWIIASIVLLFLGLFAYVGWNEYQLQRDHALADHYFAAMDKGDDAEGRKALTELLTKDGEHGFSQLARFTEARKLVKEGKNDAAALLLEEVAAMTKPPLKNLAIINSAFVIADDDKRALRRLGNIPKESVFKPHALELAGVLTARQGDVNAALALYREALTLKPEPGLRKRLEKRLQRLGG